MKPLLYLFCCLIACAGFSQQVKCYLSTSTIYASDVLEINIEIDGGSVVQPTFPKIKGMNRVGTSESTIMAQGSSQHVITASYAQDGSLKPGTYTVPAFTVNLNGKPVQTKPMSFMLKSGHNPNTTVQPSDPFAGMFDQDLFSDKTLTYKEIKGDYFLRIQLSDEQVTVGQPVMCAVTLFIREGDEQKIRVNGQQVAELEKRINGENFWQERYNSAELKPRPVQVNGKNYLAFALYKAILFPLRAGSFAFNEVYLDAYKLLVATNAGLMDQMMGKDIAYDDVRIASLPTQLSVSALPVGMTGLPVGKFSLTASLDPTACETGEPIQLKISLTGNGNMAGITPLNVVLPKGLKLYEPTSAYQIKMFEDHLTGTRTFTYPVFAYKPGDYTLEPIIFRFYDPEKGTQDSTVADGLHLHITGTELDAEANAGPDAYYLKQLPHAGNQPPFPWHMVRWLLPVLAIALPGLFIITSRRQKNYRQK